MRKITFMDTVRRTRQQERQNKPSGLIEKIEETDHPAYRVKRSFIYDGVLYKTDSPIQVNGDIFRRLFMNGYIYG